MYVVKREVKEKCRWSDESNGEDVCSMLKWYQNMFPVLLNPNEVALRFGNTGTAGLLLFSWAISVIIACCLAFEAKLPPSLLDLRSRGRIRGAEMDSLADAVAASWNSASTNLGEAGTVASGLLARLLKFRVGWDFSPKVFPLLRGFISGSGGVSLTLALCNGTNCWEDVLEMKVGPEIWVLVPDLLRDPNGVLRPLLYPGFGDCM